MGSKSLKIVEISSSRLSLEHPLGGGDVDDDADDDDDGDVNFIVLSSWIVGVVGRGVIW